MDSKLNINLELRGGAELLFNNVKTQRISLPLRQESWTIRLLISWLKDNLLVERPELFLQDESVRPGILVLINDTDWELLDQLNYVLKENDTVMFLSTLHGG